MPFFTIWRPIYTQIDGTMRIFYVPLKADVFSQPLVPFSCLVDIYCLLFKGSTPQLTILGVNGCFQAKHLKY